ncbi:ABC transporter permease [Streptosporangium roseum]|uniref:ABC transporter permease n=1 Tax=Streptosporangium roseum TaxID=2001 RepID=UPI003319702C
MTVAPSAAGTRAKDGAGGPPEERAARPWGRPALSWVLPITGVILWQILADLELITATVPAPSVVAEALGHWVAGTPKSGADLYAGTWWEQVAASGRRVTAGFLLAAAIGIPAGVLIGASRVALSLLDPVINAARTVPAPAWVPFSLAFFGLSPITAIWLISLIAFFPIVVNTISGVQQVPGVYTNAARMLGASKLTVWVRVFLPASLPFIFVGLRLGVGMAWIAVVVSELVGVKSGLGYSLYQTYQFGRMDVMIATMFTLGLLGLVSDRLVGRLGRKLIRA